MNSNLELVKSQTILFTMELNKKSLSEWLVDDIIELNEEFENNPILRKELCSNLDIKYLKDFLKKDIKPLDDELFDDCMDELKEIKDDLAWQKSDDGILIVKLEDWVQSARKRIEDLGWSRLFVGRSFFDPKKLNVGGSVIDDNESKNIKAEIDKLKPPVAPNYYLEIQ